MQAATIVFLCFCLMHCIINGSGLGFVWVGLLGRLLAIPTVPTAISSGPIVSEISVFRGHLTSQQRIRSRSPGCSPCAMVMLVVLQGKTYLVRSHQTPFLSASFFRSLQDPCWGIENQTWILHLYLSISSLESISLLLPLLGNKTLTEKEWNFLFNSTNKSTQHSYDTIINCTSTLTYYLCFDQRKNFSFMLTHNSDSFPTDTYADSNIAWISY